ncbi:hypothetical protein [uncultured Boseongicola sp.]|jgi:hypothetical protein|uniref:hypothetical protein n=1 Tax=uncultured Boseongicola sp. TaxID=1648499 RepID=UPI00260EE7CE|nr:hypothetical protein [uncultured Boseongicola sp.]
MTNTVSQIPPHARFNTLWKGDALEQFEWFEIMPWRTDKSEDGSDQRDPYQDIEGAA